MVSAISLCLLAIGLSVASSQLLSTEGDPAEAPLSDRRTFKHGKPVKLLPLVKKHKKFGGIVPHIFGKTPYPELPVIREPVKPLYKVHRYQGIEVKPVPDFSVSTPEPFIETHSAEPPSDLEHTFTSDYSFPGPLPSSNLLLYPVNDKPIFPAPAFSPPPSGHVFPSLPPPPPPKPIFQFVPVPQQPVYPSLPITAVPQIISIPRPAPPPAPILSQPPVFTSIPASLPPQPIFSAIPIKVQEPILPPLPAPSPAPIFPSVPIKIPAPVLPPVAATPSPAPVFSSVSITPPPLGHSFSAIPSPSPLPISSLPPPTPSLSSISISAPEPSFPYPPSGVPIPSFIKDISLGDIEIKDSPLPTIETPKYQEVTPAVPEEDPHSLKHTAVIKPEDGLLQKFKGWKADKASAALSHFTHFMQKPFVQYSVPLPHSSTKLPPPQPSVYPTLPHPASAHPLPLAQAPVFFPSSSPFFPPTKYENFPPNNIESPPIFNSYGVPISHDTFASPHASHDRLSSAASEEEAAIIPAPSVKRDQNSVQKPEPQQRPPAQLLQELQTQNFQPQFQSQSTSHIQPIYVPEGDKTAKEEDKPTEEPETYDYNAQKETNSENVVSDAHSYQNHKE